MVPGGNFSFLWHCPFNRMTLSWRLWHHPWWQMVPEVPPHSSSIQLWAEPVAPGDILGVKFISEAWFLHGERRLLCFSSSPSLFTLCGFVFKDSKFSLPSFVRSRWERQQRGSPCMHHENSRYSSLNVIKSLLPWEQRMSQTKLAGLHLQPEEHLIAS